MQPVKDLFRLLFFRISREQILAFDKRHLLLGVILTWIVGMGRYWDDPKAQLLQHLGLGSVIYIFCMSFLIWLVVLPYVVKPWPYFTVLTFVSLTSLPALLYAFPVERFCEAKTAIVINTRFLLVVAIWRLSLLFFFLRRVTGLSWWYIVAAALLPLCAIVTTLSILNLERAVLNVMGGLRDSGGGHASSGAYTALLFITALSWLLLAPMVMIYLTGIYSRYKYRKLRDSGSL